MTDVNSENTCCICGRGNLKKAINHAKTNKRAMMALHSSPEYHSTQEEYDLIRGTFLQNYFEIRPFRECCLKVSLFQLWWPFCSAEQNHFSNFGKGILEEHFCEIILKSGPWHRRCCLKIFFFFFFFCSGCHFV